MFDRHATPLDLVHFVSQGAIKSSGVVRDKMDAGVFNRGTLMRFTDDSHFLNVSALFKNKQKNGTVTAWFRMAQVGSDLVPLFAIGPTFPDAVIFAGPYITSFALAANVSAFGLFDLAITDSPCIQGEKWHHLAWVSDSGTWKIYVDGVARSNSGVLGGGNTGYWAKDLSDFGFVPVDFWVNMQSVLKTGCHFSLSDVCAWDRALSDDEILRLYRDPDILYQKRSRQWGNHHDIFPGGIASAAALGTPSLAHRINFTGIPSASAQGTPALDHRINFTGIPSTAALGTPSLAQALSMFGIASTAALGLPALDHRINFTGIPSTSALGTPSLAQVLTFTGIPSATAFGVPALDHRITFTGVPSAEALGTPSLTQVLSMFGIASAETLGTPALDHRISFVGIPSAEALGTQQLALLISFTGIGSTEALGLPALDHRIIFTGIPSAEAFGIPSFVVSRSEALALVAHIGRVLVEAGIGPGVAAEAALRSVAELVRAGKITLTGRAGDAPTGPALGGGIEFRVSFPQE